jgi:hypothetical protein
MTSIDTNVDNYTISELMEIIDEKSLEVKSIKSKTDKLINQFKKSNPNLSTFFFNIQSKLIQYTENTIIENSKTDNFNKETEEWYKNEALPQSNDIQK